MADMKDIVKLAVDGYKGRVEKYSVGQSQEALRDELIKVNNGKTYLDYRDIRDGKCSGLFTLLEVILNATVVEGLQGDEYFNTMVETRNVGMGDSEVFLVEDSDLFTVANVADGTQGIRRQRIGGVSEVTVPTSMKMVRIYEELNRVLANRVDFNNMILKVTESFRQKILNDIYSLWIGATADELGGEVYLQSGSYDEDTLLDLISHVEAAAGGRTATIVGTKKAVRNLQASIMADSAKEDLYNLGYYGKFYGTPVVVMPQRHKINSTEFVLDDSVLTVVAGDDKPLKFVYEGDSIVLTGDPMQNADFTQEYLYGTKYGVGIVLAGRNQGIGRYELA